MTATFDLPTAPPVLVGRKVLIIVENLPLPFDRRVWLEARTLKAAGAEVSIICPTGKGYEAAEEEINGIHIYRHPLLEAEGAGGYLREYLSALANETRLAWKIFFKHGFDVIQGCNPPDLIFLVALPFKLLGRKFIFDHHDINPELYEAKFGRRDFFWRMLKLVERLTFMTADVSIATNESYRAIAINRGKMDPEQGLRRPVRAGHRPHQAARRPTPPARRAVALSGRLCGRDGRARRHRPAAGVGRGISCTISAAPTSSSRWPAPAPVSKRLKTLSKTLKVDDYVTFLRTRSRSRNCSNCCRRPTSASIPTASIR